MHNERLRRLDEELALIEVLEALWIDNDEFARKARQIRGQEITRELNRIVVMN